MTSFSLCKALARRATVGGMPALIVVTLLGSMLSRAQPAQVGGVVTDCSSDGELRAKLASGGVITFNCNGTGSPSTIIVTVSGGFTVPIGITTLDGGNKITLIGDGTNRIFQVGEGAMAPVSFTLTNIALTNPATVVSRGGCILISDGSVWLNNITLQNCKIFGVGNNPYTGGAILNEAGIVTIANSRLLGNLAANGGAISNHGTAVLDNVILSDNSAYGGGAIHNTGTLSLSNAILSRNVGWGSGGAIYSRGNLILNKATLMGNVSYASGGGIATDAGNLTVSNATLSGNSTYVQGAGISISGTATLMNVTLSNRVTAAGIGHNLYLGGGVLTLTNTIVNSDASDGTNCAYIPSFWPQRKIVSGGHNLANDNSCALSGPGDQEGPQVPILLGPLANHGGPMLTQLPRIGSAAIDNGDPIVCAASPINNIDQRGASRTGLDTGIVCDIGAVERQYSDSDRVPWLWLPLIRR